MRNKLKGYRAQFGITQAQLSEVLKINTERFSRCENGISDFKTTEMLIIVDFFKKYDESITLDSIWG